MTLSMTGFAARRGQGAGCTWTWDLRSVNGKGLDLRLRLPDWIEGLEPMIRAEVACSLSRGNVSLTLKVARDESSGSGLRINPAALAAALAALREVEAAAMDAGMTLRQASQAEVLALRGVTEGPAEDEDTGPLRSALLADLAPLLADFAASRRAEGTALAGVIAGQVDRIAVLTEAARVEAEARRPAAADSLRTALARVLDGAGDADPARVAQELALLAIKSDVTEEIDRLTAHVAAARNHLAEKGPTGRKLDFLMQEFLREANTLCSKSQSAPLTRIGLDLKVVIDQMREQVQNVE
ncbi:MAG: YicC family protein [Paracoccaceae bacterium]|nr:MAG: YicC family protein [Paracoccaceae bacterium]